MTFSTIHTLGLCVLYFYLMYKVITTAEQFGRSGFGWLMVGLVTSPILALLFLHIRREKPNDLVMYVDTTTAHEPATRAAGKVRFYDANTL